MASAVDTEAVLELIDGSDSEIEGLWDDDSDSDPTLPVPRNVMAETQSDEEQLDEEQLDEDEAGYMTEDDVALVPPSKKKKKDQENNKIIWEQKNFTETYTESIASYDRAASIGIF